MLRANKLKYYGWLILVTTIFSCNDGNQPENSQPSKTVEIDQTKRFNVWMDSVFNEVVEQYPQWLTSLGIKRRYDEWNNLSDSLELQEYNRIKDYLAYLESHFNIEQLSVQAQLTYRLVKEDWEQHIEGYQYRYHSYPVNQMYGKHATVVSFLINKHRIDSLEDAKAYIKRIKGVNRFLAQTVEGLEKRASLGIIAPKFVFDHVINSCEQIISGVPFDDSEKLSPILEDFNKKINKLDFLNIKTKNELLSEAAEALKKDFKPAYDSLLVCVKGLKAQATEDAGAWKLPSGNDFYVFALNQTTTTELTPEEIFNTGQEEVKRIHAQMRDIMKAVGFEGDLKAFFKFMREDEQFYYDDSEEGRAAYMKEVNSIIDDMRLKLDDLFMTKPKAKLEVKAVEAFREKAAGKAFYEGGAPDGSRPGRYYANMYDMSQMPKYQMEALAYHEAIPGHHMQISINQELEELPKIRKHGLKHTAYVEGWGLYSEYIPKEMGFYDDPYADFGRLAMELWRSCRLVADVGIHYKKWTREEAINFYAENTPNALGDCVKMVERHIVMPGQATAYKIGQLRILELRKIAEDTLGEKFDIRAFHDVVLTNGSVSLTILEENVQKWIDSFENNI